MRFEEFSRDLEGKIKEHYGEQAVVAVSNIEKLNGTGYLGISVHKKGEEEIAAPVLSLEEYYAEYGERVDEAAEAAIRVIENQSDQILAHGMVDKLMNWEKVKEYVFPALISRTENKKLLERLASTEFLDLAVIYFVRLVDIQPGVCHAKVSKEQLKMWGVTNEVLHEQAIYNMRRDGYSFSDLKRFIRETVMNEEVEEDQDFTMGEEMLYVYSNSCKSYGAAGIIDETVLSESLGERSYYILPSSIHETLFVPCDKDAKVCELEKMVREVNETQVAVSDRLSDHVYLYNGKTGRVEMCA